MSDEESGVKSVVVTFKCSENFKSQIDGFSKEFDSRSEMIRESIVLAMGNMGFDVDVD